MKKPLFKLSVLFFSIAVVSLPLVSACGTTEESDAPNIADIEISGDEHQNPGADQVDMFSGLEAKTYDGKNFNIISRETQTKQFDVGEETGDIINDAVYMRNRTVEEKFDVAIKVISVAGEWDTQNTFLNTLKNSIMAGDAAFDLVDGYAAYIGSLIGAGLYLNLLDIPHLRLTEPWWSQHAVNELTIKGKLFVVPGDITTNLNRGGHSTP